MIVCRGLNAAYGSQNVLQDVHLNLDAGEIVALVGQNACGKSTLLKALSGEVAPTSGEVLWHGTALAGLSPAQVASLVAIVPQSEPAVFGFSVREAVLLARTHAQVGLFDSAEDRAVAENALQRVNIAHLGSKPITALSGGELQRVWLARALAQSTPALFLDEPTSHLDVAHVLEFAALLPMLAQEGKAILMAIHDLNLALQVATRIVVMKEGRIVFDGNPSLCEPALAQAFLVGFERGEALRAITCR